MDALGVRHLFTQPNFGGFSTDFCNPDNVGQSWKDRAEFVRIAARKLELQQPGGRRRGWHPPQPSRLHVLQVARLACRAPHVVELPVLHLAAELDVKARFHVGDAPMDVQAAVGGGAQAVGVCTGIYTRQELSEAAPGAVVLEDLQDLGAVLETFGLS